VVIGGHVENLIQEAAQYSRKGFRSTKPVHGRIAVPWRPFRAPTNRTVGTRGVAPGCYPPALSAPKPRINRTRIDRGRIRVAVSHFFLNVMASFAQSPRYCFRCRIIASKSGMLPQAVTRRRFQRRNLGSIERQCGPALRISRAVTPVGVCHFFSNVTRPNTQGARYFFGCRMSFCTRQFSNSPT
jgi:hypothetical protein